MSDKKSGIDAGTVALMLVLMIPTHFYQSTSLHFSWEKLKTIEAELKLIKRACAQPVGVHNAK